MQIIDKNIVEALKNQRPNDKVIKILSNKFAIVQGAYIGGGFDVPAVCGLHNGTIYFYGNLDTIKQFYTNNIEPMQNEYIGIYYDPFIQNGYKTYKFKRKFIKHNRYKMQYRRILKLIFLN